MKIKNADMAFGKTGVIVKGRAIPEIEIVYFGENGANTLNVDKYMPASLKDLEEMLVYFKSCEDECPRCMKVGQYLEQGSDKYDYYINEADYVLIAENYGNEDVIDFMEELLKTYRN